MCSVASLNSGLARPGWARPATAFQNGSLAGHSLAVRRKRTDGLTVQTLPLPAGTGLREQELSLRDYAPGIYFYTLLVNGTPVQTQRMLVN